MSSRVAAAMFGTRKEVCFLHRGAWRILWNPHRGKRTSRVPIGQSMPKGATPVPTSMTIFRKKGRVSKKIEKPLPCWKGVTLGIIETRLAQ